MLRTGAIRLISFPARGSRPFVEKGIDGCYYPGMRAGGDTIVHEVTATLGGDEVRRLQHIEVLRNGTRRDLEQTCKSTGTETPSAKKGYDSGPPLHSKGFEHVKIGRLHERVF